MWHNWLISLYGIYAPGRAAKAHLHSQTGIVVVVIEGYAASLIGPDLTPIYHGPGEFIFIPEGVIHVAVNLSTTQRLVAIEMRTDPAFNHDVVVPPKHEAQASRVITDLQERYASGQLEVPPNWDTQKTGPFTFADVTEEDLPRAG